MVEEQIFDFHQIISLVAQYFREKKKFEVKEHCIYEGMRVHVFGRKEIFTGSRREKEEHKIIAEVNASKIIPPLLIGKNLGKYNEKIGVLTHFQIYFHPSKIYLAVPYYATNIAEIKDLCRWEGIGLLKVSPSTNNKINVTELIPAVDRVKLFKEVLNEKTQIRSLDHKKQRKIIDEVGKIADHLLIERAVKTLALPPPSYQMNLSRNLLHKMTSLTDEVIYKEDILTFCDEYITQRLDDYEIVVKWVKKLWENHLSLTQTASSFDFYKEFESILKLDREYRDHFLHQFQVFLLGTLILDGIFHKFQDSYKKPFDHLSENSVFKSWLITSTFHDFAYPLERYTKWNDELFERLLNLKESPTKIGFEKITTEKNFLEYLDQIDHLISCYKTPGSKWCFKKPYTTNENLRRFLLNKIVHERNHGVLSSLALLKKSGSEQIQISDETMSTEIYPAAVAIAIHDEGIWQPFRGKIPSWRKESCEWEEEFKKCNYLNHLDFSNQPLSFLLIFCDTAQEFGRPKFPSLNDTSTPKTIFEDISVNEDKVRIIISVDTTTAFTKKEKDLNDTIDFLKCSEIEFVFRLEDKEAGTGRDFPVTS